MKLNEFRTLGRSGLRVSPITLGAMTFGDGGWGAGATINGVQSSEFRIRREK